jgi:hypothetical protein
VEEADSWDTNLQEKPSSDPTATTRTLPPDVHLLFLNMATDMIEECGNGY